LDGCKICGKAKTVEETYVLNKVGEEMAAYPGSERETRIEANQLRAACIKIFEACGMAGSDAGLLSDTLVFADVRGIHSHGTLRVAEYVDKLQSKGVNPKGRPMTVSDRGSAIVVDGGNAMGQIACHFATQSAIQRARSANVAVVAIRGSNHCGALSFFSEQVREAGMIGICASNALPTMAPWGGIDKILGISPLAISIPSEAAPPIVFDAAFSASAHGKIRVYAQKGENIPLDWAYDEGGRPTSDPEAAIKGLLQPIGGHKGTGLAIVWGILSTLLSGAAFGTELGNMIDGPKPGKDGQIIMALNVAGFTDLKEFRLRVDRIVEQIRSSRPAPQVSRVYSPGELEAVTESQYGQQGIPLNDETYASIGAAARRLGVELDGAFPGI